MTIEIIACEIIKYTVEKHCITTNEEKLVVDSCIVNLLPQFSDQQTLRALRKRHCGSRPDVVFHFSIYRNKLASYYTITIKKLVNS